MSLSLVFPDRGPYACFYCSHKSIELLSCAKRTDIPTVRLLSFLPLCAISSWTSICYNDIYLPIKLKRYCVVSGIITMFILWYYSTEEFRVAIPCKEATYITGVSVYITPCTSGPTEESARGITLMCNIVPSKIKVIFGDMMRKICSQTGARTRNLLITSQTRSCQISPPGQTDIFPILLLLYS